MSTWEEIVEDIIYRVEMQHKMADHKNEAPVHTSHNQKLMNPSTDTSLTLPSENHNLMVQESHEIMLVEHNLPTVPSEHQELVNTNHNTALENTSEHTDLMVQSTPNSLVTSAQDTSLVAQTV